MNWFYDSLGDIFWHVDNLPISERNKQFHSSMFFDLANLRIKLPPQHIQILVTILTSYFVNLHDFRVPLSVFIEEAQVQIQQKSQFSPIDEIISVLRYKGVKTYVIATRIDNLSKHIRDAGLVCQFRTDPIYTDQYYDKIKPWNLPNFRVLIKSPLNPKFQLVNLIPFGKKHKYKVFENNLSQLFQKIDLLNINNNYFYL